MRIQDLYVGVFPIPLYIRNVFHTHTHTYTHTPTRPRAYARARTVEARQNRQSLVSGISLQTVPKRLEMTTIPDSPRYTLY